MKDKKYENSVDLTRVIMKRHSKHFALQPVKILVKIKFGAPGRNRAFVLWFWRPSDFTN